jgi:hypothetical protein
MADHLEINRMGTGACALTGVIVIPDMENAGLGAVVRKRLTCRYITCRLKRCEMHRSKL